MTTPTPTTRARPTPGRRKSCCRRRSGAAPVAKSDSTSRVTHRGTAAALLTLTVLGLDSRWAPEPAVIGPLEPGQSAQVTLTLVPERGALGLATRSSLPPRPAAARASAR